MPGIQENKTLTNILTCNVTAFGKTNVLRSTTLRQLTKILLISDRCSNLYMSRILWCPN